MSGPGGGKVLAGGSARVACTGREGLAVKAEGDRACAERTRNMLYMVVTLDVSQLETSALKFFNS